MPVRIKLTDLHLALFIEALAHYLDPEYGPDLPLGLKGEAETLLFWLRTEAERRGLRGAIHDPSVSLQNRVERLPPI